MKPRVILDRSFAPFDLSEHITQKADGYIVCRDVPIMRDGTMLYGPGEMPGEQSWTEVSRSVEDILRQETIDSFEGQPLTIYHPKEFVNPENWQKETVGIVYNVRPGVGKNVNKLVADFLITAKRAIDRVLSKDLREVSAGYWFKYESTGEGRGRVFDLVGNHVALVDAGRCGAECAIFDNAPNNTKPPIGLKPSRQKETNMSWKDKLMSAFGRALDEAGIDDDTPPAVRRIRDCGGHQQNGGQSADVAALAASVKVLVDRAAREDAERDAEKKRASDEAAAKAAADKAAADAASAASAKAEADRKAAEDAGEPDGETMSLAEVLVPGIAKSKDVRAKALEGAYGDPAGKTIIDSLLGSGRTLDDAAKADRTLFIAAAQMMKTHRNAMLSQAISLDHLTGTAPGAMTPEKINDINAKFYGGQQAAH